MGSTGSELCSALPARGAGRRTPSVRVEARAREPLGSQVWCGGSGFGMRHQRAGTSAGRSGFQKCPFVMPLPGSASSPFPAPPPPPISRAAGLRRSSLGVPLWTSLPPPPVPAYPRAAPTGRGCWEKRPLIAACDSGQEMGRAEWQCSLPGANPHLLGRVGAGLGRGYLLASSRESWFFFKPQGSLSWPRQQ